MDQPANDRRADLPGRMVAEMTAAAAGLVLPQPWGALVGGAAVPVLERIAQFDRRAAWNGAAVASSAAVHADMTPEEFDAWVAGDDRRLMLLVAAVQAAWRTLDERKLRVLSALLADATKDDTRLDVSWLMATALNDMEWPHIQVLRALRDDLNVHGEDKSGSRTWTNGEMAKHLPHLSDGIDAVIAALQRHGCAVYVKGFYESGGVSVSLFGKALLSSVERAPPLVRD